MLTFLNIAQAVLYIALLALLGQGLLYVLAGSRRQSNFFYQTLALIARPATYLVRLVTPRRIDDRHIPVITFLLLLVLSFVVFVERGYLLCEQLGHQDCRG